MNDLIERLRVAIDDAELAAMRCQERDWRVAAGNSCEVYVIRPDHSERTIARCLNGYDDDFASAVHIAKQNPARTLAMVAAHRKILAEYEEACVYYEAHKSAPAGEVHGLWTAIKMIAEGYGITAR